MNSKKIIFSFFVIVLGLGFLVLVSFFSLKKDLDKNDFAFFKSNGIFEIKDDSQKSFSGVFDESLLYVNYFSYLDRVFFLGKYSTGFTFENNDFFLKDGFYVFDLQSIWENFTIKNDYLRIKPLSPGKIFIDIRDKRAIKIFSFNGVYEIEFFNKEESLTKLVIYPHMYFSFSEKRIKAFKNVMFSRLEQITNIKYISKTFNLQSLNKNDYFYNDFYKNDPFIDNFFISLSNFLYKKKNIDYFDLKNLTFLEEKELRGLEYINRFFVLFFNVDKKIVFYKKNILNNLGVFFDKNKSKKDLLKYTETIEEDLKKLKTLSYKDYEDILNMIYFYYNNLLNINNYDYVDNIILLSKLIYNLNNKNIDPLLDSYFYLSKMYSLIDSKKIDKNNLQKSLIDYVLLFFKVKGIDLDDKILVIKELKKEKFSFDLEYLGFFLKNILFFDIDYGDKESFLLTLKILNFYTSLNLNLNNIFESKNSEDIIISYNDLIEKIIKEIGNNYFSGRNDKNLLILNTQKSLGNKAIDGLEKIIKDMYDFFEQNKKNITQKNLIYIDYYRKNKILLEEYFLALKNYTKYSIKYDKQKEKLVNTKSLLEKKEEQNLSKESFLEYIKKFNNLDLYSIDIKIIGDKYYVKNLVFDQNKIDFFLYPFEGNFMDNIVLNGEKINSSFELDELEKLYDEKYENAQDEEKEKYDFRNFFVNTFSPKKDDRANSSYDKEIVDKNYSEKDRLIFVFKRDKLFGNKGDFNLIKKKLKTNFDDIEVIDDNGKYRVFVRKSFFSFDDKNYSGNKIIGSMSGEYVITETKRYFKDIKVNFYDFYSYQSNNELNPIFDGRQFEIKKIIDIFKFNEIFEEEVLNIYYNNN